jgi:small-conductance mechanosensitive channel
MTGIDQLLDYTLFEIYSKEVKVFNVVMPLFILLIGKVLVEILMLALNRSFKRRSVDAGRQYAVKQILKYIFYTLIIIFAVQSVGFDISILLASSAALLVGVGLGLQQLFKDIVGGIVLLSEGTLKINDFVDLDGMVGSVVKIGIRTSVLRTRENIMVIVPNSRFIDEKVVNWTHNENLTRFKITVGVAYGSDTALVKKLLMQCAVEHPHIVEQPSPFVRFIDFGNSSIDFELLFWSGEYLTIEDVKSDLRFHINDLFKQHHITIPFPQRDLHIKSSDLTSLK